jgi:hypothetical protein
MPMAFVAPALISKHVKTFWPQWVMSEEMVTGSLC